MHRSHDPPQARAHMELDPRALFYMLTPLVLAERHMAILLSARLLPFAAYIVLRRRTRLRTKLLVAAAYLLVPVAACSLGATPTIKLLAIGFAYYCTISLITNRLRDAVSKKKLTRTELLIMLFVIYLLLPGIAFPGTALATFLVIGCEIALSAYSYCVETSRAGIGKPSLKACLFFLFVNPTVVYTVRGVRTKTADFWGFLRAGAGCLVMFLNAAAMRPLAHYLKIQGDAHGSMNLAWLSAYGAVGFLSLYAAHSGLASIQIGLMRQIGCTVPERYRYPLMSTSPIDFWRRWNIYVRLWLEAYVFLPLAFRVAKRTESSWGQVLAAVATLTASGALHGAVIFAGRQNLADLKGQEEFFLAAGIFLASWRFGSAIGKMVRKRLDSRSGLRFDRWLNFAGRIGLGSALVAATIAWG